MKTWLLFLLASASAIVLDLVHGQLDSCTGSHCLSDEPVTYTCTIVAVSLRWIVTDASNSEVGRKSYSVEGTVGETETIDSHFTTNLTNSTGRVVSTISFTPVSSLNNYNIECLQVTVDNSGVSYTCPITIADIPPAPALPINYLAFTDTELTFLWNTTSNSTCFSHYSVNVTSIDYTIDTTNTNLTLPIYSTNDTEYSISVVTVDTGGRYMNPQGVRTFIADVPLPVTNVMLRQSDFSGDNNSTVDIIVTWNEPPSSPRPPIIQYVISHNITTGPMIQTNSSQRDYTLSGATVGSVYTVGIAASNVLGIGSPITATITIYATSSTEVSSIPISISTSSPSGIMMTATPTISHSMPPAPTEKLLSNTGTVVGVSIGVVVVIAVFIIDLIVVFVGIWLITKKKSMHKNATPRASDKLNTEAINYVYDEVNHPKSSSVSPPELESQPDDIATCTKF